MTLFVGHVLSAGSASRIRLLLGDCHPYRRLLWKSGFVARPAEAAVQVRAADGCFDQRACHITSGDKDI